MGLTDKILKIGMIGSVGFFVLAIILAVIYLLIPSIVGMLLGVDVNSTTQIAMTTQELIKNTKGFFGVLMMLAIVLSPISFAIAHIAAIIEIIGLKIDTSTKIKWIIGLLLPAISVIVILVYYFEFRKKHLKIESDKKV